MKQNRTILVVDDLPTNRLVAHLLLEDMGFQVVEAADGAEAVAALAEGEFDLVLMDCQMPVMDGLQATSVIRAQKSETPIIAYTTDDNRVECLRAGMNDHLPKPAPAAVLRDRVEFWLNQAA